MSHEKYVNIWNLTCKSAIPNIKSQIKPWKIFQKLPKKYITLLSNVTIRVPNFSNIGNKWNRFPWQRIFPIMKDRHFFETLTFYILTNNADIVLKFIPDTCGYMPTLHKNRDLHSSKVKVTTCYHWFKKVTEK